MSESEALAQAFVSGFCISDGPGMLGRPHGPWTNLPLCGFGPIPIVFRQSVGWDDFFQICHLRSTSRREIPKQSTGEIKGQPELRLKIGA